MSPDFRNDVSRWLVLPENRELHDTSEYLLSFVVFQNMNFVVVFLDSLFKTGKSGTQWYCVIPVTFPGFATNSVHDPVGSVIPVIQLY